MAIVTNDAVLREALLELVAGQSNINLVGVAVDAAGLARLAAANAIDVVMTEWPGLALAESELAEDFDEVAAKTEPLLTAREIEVLAAVADGASNKTIARQLGISFHTVKFHIASILDKLDADSRTEAVTKAARLGLVML